MEKVVMLCRDPQGSNRYEYVDLDEIDQPNVIAVRIPNDQSVDFGDLEIIGQDQRIHHTIYVIRCQDQQQATWLALQYPQVNLTDLVLSPSELDPLVPSELRPIGPNGIENTPALQRLLERITL